MIAKCTECPLSAWCVVEWTGHRPYCDWGRAGGVWRDRLIALSRTPSDAPEPPAAPPAAPPAIRVDYGAAAPPGRCCR